MENSSQATVTQDIKVSDVLSMLKEGKTRKEINEHYGLNTNSAKALWATQSLKRRKRAQSGKEVTIRVIDDVASKATVSPDQTVASVSPAPAPAQADNAGTEAVAADPAQQAIADAANATTEAPAQGWSS